MYWKAPSWHLQQHHVNIRSNLVKSGQHSQSPCPYLMLPIRVLNRLKKGSATHWKCIGDHKCNIKVTL
jgi:hypothetical protein